MPPFLDPILLLAVLAAGRALLSLLPAGRPGGHGARELPATLAASCLLGVLLSQAAGYLGLTWGLTWGLTCLSFLTFAGVVTLGWRLFGIGGLVPRYAPQLPPRGWRGWLPWLLVLSRLVEAWTASPAAPWLFAAVPLAALVLIERGLREARADPRTTAVSLAIVAMYPGAFGFGLSTALLLAAATAVASGWVWRAERRALWLAALIVAGCGSTWAGLVLIAALVVATAGPSRRRALLPAGLAALAVAGTSLADGAPPWQFEDGLLALLPAVLIGLVLHFGRSR